MVYTHALPALPFSIALGVMLNFTTMMVIYKLYVTTLTTLTTNYIFLLRVRSESDC